MTITEHKRLISQIPEDLKDGEEIEVSSDGCNWCTEIFRGYGRCGSLNTNSHSWRYARRPAAAQKKRLKDEPWIGNLHHDRSLYSDWGWIRDESGNLIIKVALPTHDESVLNEHRRRKTDPTQHIVDAILSAINGQNSLEGRQTAHQQHMADLDKGIKAAEEEPS